MARLKNRQLQIPGGFVFFQPQTGWKPRPFSSFNVVVNSLISHRKANPALAKKHNWAMDYDSVAEEVEAFNAKVCQIHGWNDYIIASPGTPPLPKNWPRNSQAAEHLGNVVVGGSILIHWIASGAEAVAPELSEARAQQCVKCPKHGKGPWTAYFTKPLAEAIRAKLNFRRELKLETSVDEVLKVCEACDCPLPLKVHLKIDRLNKEMPAEQKAKLVPECWIHKEIAALNG